MGNTGGGGIKKKDDGKVDNAKSEFVYENDEHKKQCEASAALI